MDNHQTTIQKLPSRECQNLTPKELERAAVRSAMFAGFSPRELDIYLSGIADGKAIARDEIQPRLSQLESAIHNHGILFTL